MEFQIIFDRNDMNYYKLKGLKEFIEVIQRNNNVDANFEFIENHLIKILVKPRVKEEFGIKWFDNKKDYKEYLDWYSKDKW